MNLKNIDHIGIIVGNSDMSKEFYTKVLGMKFTGKAKSNITGDIYTHLVHFINGTMDSHIELVEISDKSPLKKAKISKLGISHIAYRVDDIESALRELKNAENEIILDVTVIGDIKFAYVKTKDNYVFEVMEMPEKYANSYQVK